MGEEAQDGGQEKVETAQPQPQHRRKIVLESSLMKSVLEIQHGRSSSSSSSSATAPSAASGTAAASSPGKAGKKQGGGEGKMKDRDREREQAREREKARAAKLRMEETALAKKKDKQAANKGGGGKKAPKGKKGGRAKESKESQMLSQQEREREEVRQRKMAWVEKQAGGARGDTRKVQASGAGDTTARITPAGPPEKITVSIGPDAAVEKAGSSSSRSSRTQASAGKDAATWADLDPVEKRAAATLGWTAPSWNAGDGCDASYCSWQQLSAEQRKAAVQLGYDVASWNADAGLDDDTGGPTQNHGALTSHAGSKGPKGNGGNAGQRHEATQRATSSAGRGHERIVTRSGSGSDVVKGSAAAAASFDEAQLEARLESEGKLPPHYVRGRESVLVLKIETGPKKRAALVVRKGEDPGWLASGFCRRHNIPSQLTAVVQQNIAANLAALDATDKD
eukprot:COSAG02_NODE_307_length_25111_cov_5.306693_2_plen_453_part_00